MKSNLIKVRFPEEQKCCLKEPIFVRIQLFILSGSRQLRSVSYTHLDVYKRQYMESITPNLGPTGGGTLVEIRGEHLGSTKKLFFGGKEPLVSTDKPKEDLANGEYCLSLIHICTAANDGKMLRKLRSPFITACLVLFLSLNHE